MKLENLALAPCENVLTRNVEVFKNKKSVSHTSESNTAGLDKKIFCPLYVGDYPHFDRD